MKPLILIAIASLLSSCSMKTTVEFSTKLDEEQTLTYESPPKFPILATGGKEGTDGQDIIDIPFI